MVAPMFYISESKTTVSQFGSASFEAENECHDVEAGGCRDRPEAAAGNVAEATGAPTRGDDAEDPAKRGGPTEAFRLAGGPSSLTAIQYFSRTISIISAIHFLIP